MPRDRILCTNGQGTTPLRVNVYFTNGENSNGLALGDIIHLDNDMRFRVVDLGSMVGWSQMEMGVEDLDGYGGAPDGTGAYYTPTPKFKLSQPPSADVETTQPLLHAMQVRDNQVVDQMLPSNTATLERFSIVNGHPLLDNAPWPSIDTIVFPAGEILAAHTSVYLGTDGRVYTANNMDSAHAHFVVGVVTEPVAENEQALIARGGVWTCDQTFSRGPLFLDNAGHLTNTVPSYSGNGAVFHKQMGVALGDHQYLIELHDPIILV